MTIAPITLGDTQSRAKLNAAIAKANEVDSKASLTALTAEAAARVAAGNAEATARREALLALPLPSMIQSRPGDAPHLFCASLAAGPWEAVPSLSTALVRTGDRGRVIRVVGDGMVAPRAMMPIEPGRRYLAEFAVQRRINSPDPANDAAVCALAWYGQNFDRLASPAETVVENITTMTVGVGRVVTRAVVSSLAGSDVDVVSPAPARYCRPYVEAFGTLTQNDVEVIRWIDITEVNLVSPDFSGISDRVDELEAVGSGDRLDYLESVLDAPNARRVETRGAIAALTVAAGVKTIETLGEAEAGDRGGARYSRAGAEPAHDLWAASVDGAVWENSENLIHVNMADMSGGVANALNKAAETGRLVFLPAGAYELDEDVNVGGGAILVAPNATADDWSKIKPRGLWTDGPAGANIWRFRDRVFVDDGANASGNFENDYPGIFGELLGWMPREGSVVSISSQGRLAVVGLSRTAQQGGPGDPLPPESPHKAAIGGAFGVINDEVDNPRGAWAAYTDAVRMPGGGVTHGIENDTANAGTYVEFDPYAPLAEADGFTTGIWNMAGGSTNGLVDLEDSSVAYFAGPNGARWGKGLVFHPQGLRDRGDGVATAIQMGGGHRVEWHRYDETGAAGELAAFVDSRSFTSGGKVSFLSFEGPNTRIGTDSLLVGRPGDAFSGIEIGGGTTADKTAYLDFVASPGVDYSSRIVRSPGDNGTLQFQHRGAGAVTFEMEDETDFSFISNGNTWLRCEDDQNLYLGVADTSVGRTHGVPMIPTVSGPPTGAISPTVGHAPMLIDAINRRLYILVGGEWKYAALI